MKNMLSVRFLYGLTVWLDLHFLPVYFVCTVGVCVYSRLSTGVGFAAIMAYLPLQYARLKSGLNAARQQTCFGVITFAILGPPVFLVHLYFLRSSPVGLRMELSLGIVSMIFSVLETFLVVWYFVTLRVGEFQTVTSLIQWMLLLLSAGVLLFSLIYSKYLLFHMALLCLLFR